MKNLALMVMLLVLAGCSTTKITKIYDSDYGSVGVNWQVNEILACEFHTVDGRIMADEPVNMQTILICDEHNALFSYRNNFGWKPYMAVEKAEQYPVSFHGSKSEGAEWQCQRTKKGFDCD